MEDVRMTRSHAGCLDTAGLPADYTGVTLPELLVSLALTSIITLTAVDFLPRFIHSNRMAGEVNRFIVALRLARSEAVKRGRRLVLCPQADRHICARHADWGNGWLLFASEDRERDANEALILTGPPLADFISMHSGNRRKRVVYQPDGSSGGTNSSFTFCDRYHLASPRVICLSNTGRPRTTHTRCDGSPIECP
jgi:type IV fimbrial biogenesis protein FimT